MHATDLSNFTWFVAWLVAVGVLFAAGVRLPLQPALSGWRAATYSIGTILAAAAVLFVANVALISHDTHIDLTQDKVFTPSERAMAVADHLDRDVYLTWFYQSEDQNGGRVKEIVELMGKRNPHLKVRTIDPDKQPSLAQTYGIKLYNAAVVESEGRRLLVQSTDENEIAVGIMKVLREHAVVACFAEGHNELSTVNPERQEHFETGIGTNDINAESMVTVTIPRGLMLLSRALEAQGYVSKRITAATLSEIPHECTLTVVGNPRTAYLPAEIEQFENYLARGGSLLLLYDIGYAIEPRLAGLLAKLGVRISPDIVVDPLSHYSTDLEIVAVPAYERHPVTQHLSVTFFPGVRELEAATPAAGVKVTPLFFSSNESFTHSGEAGGWEMSRASASVAQKSTLKKEARSRMLGVAAEGMWPGADATGRPFRAIIVGDADFATNKYFPAVANSDLTLSMIRWLAHEERAPPAKSRIPVAPSILLTKSQTRGVFLLVGVLLPLSAAALGIWAWWRRR